MRVLVLSISSYAAVCLLALLHGAEAMAPESSFLLVPRGGATSQVDSDVLSGFGTISVRGSADVSVVPDRAILTIMIESREKGPDQAMEQNDKKIKKVMEFLKSAGVDSRSIRTELMNIRPLYGDEANWSRPPPGPSHRGRQFDPVGYTVERGLVIKIKDLNSFETILSGLTKQGVNRINGVRFETSDLKKYRDMARLQAVRHAKAKALAMAGELGASLTTVHSITENTMERGPFHHYSYYGQMQSQQMSSRAGEDSDNDGVQAGAIEVKASVHVVFRLHEEEGPSTKLE